jgi:murein DD-endopeptidase MepM/ murein hydrolase activator NlpD
MAGIVLLYFAARESSVFFGLMRRCRSSVPLKSRGFRVLVFAALVSVVSCALYRTAGNGSLMHGRVSMPAQQSTLDGKFVKPPVKTIVATFGRNETITAALSRFGLSGPQIYEFVKSALPVYNLARVKAGRNYWLNLASDGSVLDFRYPIDDSRYLTVYRERDRLVPVMKDFAYEKRAEIVSGAIEGSLFLALADSGEQDRLALDLADIFTWDIDFYTDIQKGDSFRMLVEKEYLDGKFVKYGPILAATIRNRSRDFWGYRFVDEEGKAGYFAQDGRALKRSFLKSPLKFARVSSKFTGARMHPILKIVRPHLGVDYAAPVGTPVVAVGSGTVTAAGSGGAGGNMVTLRHSGNYESLYLHLSRIAVRRGARVEQGELIGLVGATGMATGPHLDFRVKFHGKFVNPAKVVFPPAAPISQAAMARFMALRDALVVRLENLRASN